MTDLAFQDWPLPSPGALSSHTRSSALALSPPASFLSLDYAKVIPTSGLLHLLGSLPGMRPSQTSHGSPSLLSRVPLSSLLKSHLLREAFPLYEI